MITTVLASESYLFTAREIWVLHHILELPYEPHYLLTRLLLRRPGKVHPLASLINAYSPELGEEGVKRAALSLCSALDVPAPVLEEDPFPSESTECTMSSGSPQNGMPTPSKRGVNGARPWSSFPTGLSEEDERADPELAEALRMSLWTDQYGSLTEQGAASSSHTNEVGGTPPNTTSASYEASLSSLGNIGLTLSDFDLQFSLEDTVAPRIGSLAHSEQELSLEQLLSCAPADELRRVARARKIPPSSLITRDTTIKALLESARKQTTLAFAPLKGKGKAKADEIASSCTSSSERKVIEETLPYLGGHAINIDRAVYTLISRVNLIFSRTPPQTALAPALLLPPILVASSKRHYPDYGEPKRKPVWASRAEMLQWERAVTWEALVSDALGDYWSQSRRSGPPALNFGRMENLSRTDGARIVRKVWEGVWPIWKQMIAAGASDGLPHGEDRFRTEHVLTRIVYKVTWKEILSADNRVRRHWGFCMSTISSVKFCELCWHSADGAVASEGELSEIERLTDSSAWYERLGLVLMTHYGKGSEQVMITKLEEATQVCIDGLLDEDTHLSEHLSHAVKLTEVYRPGLSRRLTRLENKLNLPPEERHISYAELQQCETRDIIAQRSQQNVGHVRQPRPEVFSREVSPDREQDTVGIPQVGKSAWQGRDGEVTVEGCVLEWWEDKGYEGFHAESSILTTLFALLMWPVLFLPLPGAFQTRYQTAPLDLGEDTFARARRDLIEQRLEAMQKTSEALEMLRETDARERARGTWAVGLSWDFGSRELEEITECLGGRALAIICRMLSEEYRHRASGVPDLIVWNYPERIARFVEVKGPGDSLSETQKVSK